MTKTAKIILSLSAVVLLLGGGAAGAYFYWKSHKHHKKRPQPTATTKTVSTNYDGIDVSHYQGNIDWSKVAKDKNIQFVYIKATQGTSMIDKCYAYNVKNARKNGLKVGAYHFFSYQTPATKQFENFKKVVPKGSTDLIPMVDVEIPLETLKKKGIPLSAFQASVQVFMNLCKNYYGKYPMIYGTNRSYNELCGEDFLKYHLYIGRYGKNKPAVCKSQTHHTIWQFSEHGKINGIPKEVDLCRFDNGKTIKDITL